MSDEEALSIVYGYCNQRDLRMEIPNNFMAVERNVWKVIASIIKDLKKLKEGEAPKGEG